MNENITVEVEAKASAAKASVIELSKILNNLVSSVTAAGKSFAGMVKEMATAENSASGFRKKLHDLYAGMVRIAYYRAIRTAIRELTQGIKEGIGNLYQYSIALDNFDSSKARGTMDSFATTALYVKNTLGAMLMPVLQALVPVVDAIATAFIWAANAINQFFHALKGETRYTKAIEYTTQYTDALTGASGAAKELKKQVFGFDELNIFNAPTGGGGGAKAPELDYSKMFDEADVSKTLLKVRTAIEKELKKIKQTIQDNLGMDFFVRLKANFSEILFDWEDLNKEQIAEKILTGFYGLLGGIAGFAIGGSFGAIVGSILGVSLGVYISTIDFNGDGELSQEEILNMIKDVAIVLTGAVVGWTIGGPKGALLGASIGAGLTAVIKSFVPEAGMAFAGIEFAALLLAVIKKIAEGKTLGFVPGVAGAVSQFGIIAAAAVTLNIISIITADGYKTTQEKIAVGLVEALNLIAGATMGAAAATVFGFAVGGPGGALIGLTIAAGLNILINAIKWDYTPQSKRELDDMGLKIDQVAIDQYYYRQEHSALDVRTGGRARGGFVPEGDYFYAGEQGPELVGVVGGRTHVTNQEQFTAGMETIMDNTNTVILQAAQALIQAIQSKDMTAVVSIGDRQIVSAYDRGKKLAGASLVE